MRVQASIALLLLGCGAGAGAGQGSVEPTELSVELRGNRIVFNHKIEFEHDSDRLLTESHQVLDAICSLLSEHDEIYRVQVQGHTSTVGEEEHNQDLSTRRAATVAEYLRGHGVSQDVTSQGYGETYPRCHEETDECHGENRRVEFFVDAQ